MRETGNDVALSSNGKAQRLAQLFRNGRFRAFSVQPKVIKKYCGHKGKYKPNPGLIYSPRTGFSRRASPQASTGRLSIRRSRRMPVDWAIDRPAAVRHRDAGSAGSSPAPGDTRPGKRADRPADPFPRRPPGFRDHQTLTVDPGAPAFPLPLPAAGHGRPPGNEEVRRPRRVDRRETLTRRRQPPAFRGPGVFSLRFNPTYGVRGLRAPRGLAGEQAARRCGAGCRSCRRPRRSPASRRRPPPPPAGRSGAAACRRRRRPSGPPAPGRRRAACSPHRRQHRRRQDSRCSGMPSRCSAAPEARPFECG